MADDYAGNTSTTGVVVAGGQPVFGTIETADDSDWFKVTLQAGQTYEFLLLQTTPANLSLPDPYLELFGPGGVYITADDDSAGDLGASIVFTATTSGTYFLAAWGATAGDLGAYALVVDDHGDAPSTAGKISVGTSVNGGIELGNDIDWYAVTLNAGTQYTVNLKGAPSGQGTLADPFLNGIYDAQGNYLAGTVNDDFGSSTESRVVFTPATTGTYYVAAAGYDSSDTGTYRLSISGTAAPDIAASTATTATLTVGSTLRSTVGTAGDVDWVKVTLEANKTYVVELNADDNTFNPLADPSFIGIYNAAGVLQPGTSNDDYGVGLNSLATFTPTTSGTYYLAAGAYGGETGAYALSLLTAAQSTDTVGQTTATAAPLTLGTALSSAVNGARDVDWFKVTLSAGQTYQVEARGIASGAGTLADPQIVGIYNSAGRIILGTGNDDANGTLDAMDIFRPTSSGSYYVAVSAADDGTGSYQVSVKTTAATGDIADDATTSATLANNGTLSSTIDKPGDVDWVKVNLTSGTTYKIEQLGLPTDDGTLADAQILGVYDSRGLALNNSADDDGGIGSNALINVVAPATGTYYVAVGGYGDETGTYKLKLTTGSADTVAPTLRSTSPADNTGSVPVASNLTLEFSEAVKAGSGNITISGGGQTKVISVTDASQVSFNGKTMTLNPSANLLAGTDYTVTFGAGVVKDLAGNNFAGVTSNTQFNFKTAPAASTESWTVMVYMAADNNLERFAIDDLNEMESVALPGSINLMALVDRAAGYDGSNGNWTNTRSGAISADNNLTTVSSGLSSLGELNTGSAQTLTDFINASVASRPADNYALIIWNHGGGLSGTSWDDGSGGDNLTLSEMRQAVSTSSIGRLDFIGFDACLQGMLEQAWDMRGLADVVVASQDLVPGDGWEYQDFLGQLGANPAMTAFDLADSVIDAFATRYAGEANTTLSATRTGALEALRTALDGFTEAAIAAGNGIVTALKTAVSRTTEFDAANKHDNRDLGDFLREVGAAVSDSSVKAAAASALSALEAAVLARTGTVAGANGLSVYLPTSGISDSYVPQEYQFLQSSGWGNFLRFLNNDQRADNLVGDGLNNTVRGFAGNDTINGGAGNDTLDGGTGNDSMTGGAGNDTYYVQSSGDRVVESAGGGTDTVFSALSGYTLAANVENARVNTTSSANLSGNALDNVLTAGAGNNVLNGDAGVDTVDYGSAGSAVTVSLGTNSTQATGGSGSDTLISIENIVGSAFNDRLTGNDADNVLNGAAGNDTLTGGDGNDTYLVGSAGDTVVETNAAPEGGIDTVLSTLPSYTLGSNVENGRITTNATANLTGNSLANVLGAGAGNNVLNGGSGFDTADYGGAAAAVTVSLAVTAAQATGGSGSDTLTSIEGLIGSTFSDRLTGSSSSNRLDGGAGNDSLVGGEGNDTLSGGDGNDTLSGGSGNDSLIGGLGNDSYVIDGTGDRINEASTLATEVDSVSSSVTWTLGANLERLTLTGTGTINGTGNTLANTITGNTGNNSLSGGDGNDTLSGGDGNDTLSGGAGNDNLTGGAGADVFRFASALNGSSNVDRITSFNVVDDVLQLENSVFTKLTTTGVLSSSRFVASTTGNAVDTNDYLLYDTDSGQLFYDADGSGTGVKVLIATLDNKPVLTAADIFVT